MNYSGYKRFDVINGPGLRHSLFVSGCTHHCKGCFNAATWNFDFGEPFTKQLEDQIVSDLKIEYVKISGLSVLGGEPFQNVEGLLFLLKRVKNECEDKSIWVWSGYTFEEILDDEKKKELLSLCDVLVDGKFKLEDRNLKLNFRGSNNQRIIDVQKSLTEGRPILYRD